MLSLLLATTTAAALSYATLDDAVGETSWLCLSG